MWQDNFSHSYDFITKIKYKINVQTKAKINK